MEQRTLTLHRDVATPGTNTGLMQKVYEISYHCKEARVNAKVAPSLCYLAFCRSTVIGRQKSAFDPLN